MASSAESGAIFWVRFFQMIFSVRSVSYSSILSGKLLDEGFYHVVKFGRDIFRQSANPDVARGKARPGNVLHDGQDCLPFPEGIEEHGHGAYIEGMGREPEQMRSETLQLTENDSQVLGPLGYLQAR